MKSVFNIAGENIVLMFHEMNHVVRGRSSKPGFEGRGPAIATLGKPLPGGNWPEQDSTAHVGPAAHSHGGSGWLEMGGQGERCAVT